MKCPFKVNKTLWLLSVLTAINRVPFVWNAYLDTVSGSGTPNSLNCCQIYPEKLSYLYFIALDTTDFKHYNPLFTSLFPQNALKQYKFRSQSLNTPMWTSTYLWTRIIKAKRSNAPSLSTHFTFWKFFYYQKYFKSIGWNSGEAETDFQRWLNWRAIIACCSSCSAVVLFFA